MSSAKRLLADSLSRVLSTNAAGHLREARIARSPDHTVPPDALRALLERRGFPAPEPLLDLEARAGGAAFPRGRLLGAACFLNACPDLRVKDLPRLGGGPVFPILGDPEHLAEWESPFAMMDAAGVISIYDAPDGPAPACASLEQLLELEALAPLTAALHAVRVDALCGELVAGLVGAEPHAPATGEHASGFVGAGVWVKELRLALEGGEKWSSLHGTFLMSEQIDQLLDAMSLLWEEGYGLGHRGPTAQPVEGSKKVLAFVDANPELGYRAQVEVTVWRGKEGYAVTRRVMT